MIGKFLEPWIPKAGMMGISFSSTFACISIICDGAHGMPVYITTGISICSSIILLFWDVPEPKQPATGDSRL